MLPEHVQEVFWLFDDVRDAMIAARNVVAKHGTMPGEELDAAKDAFGDCSRQISRGRHHAVEPEGNRSGPRAHVEMNITGPGPLSLCDQTLQNLRRGWFGARSVPSRNGAKFSHNVSGRDHGIVNGVEQPEYFRT